MHKVLVKHQLQSEVAKEYHVSNYLVSTLCKKVENNKNWLEEMSRQKEIAMVQDKEISEFVQDMNERNVYIDSIKSV